MNCEYSDKILLYFYHEADEALTKEIDSHLKVCVECKESLKVLGGVSGYLDASKVQPPEYLIEDIIRQSREEEAFKFNFKNILESCRFHWKASASVLVFAVLAVGVFFPFGFDKTDFNWTSNIDSDIDSLEYAMYEERDSFFGGYGESGEDFEYEYIDDEMESIDSENGRIL